MSDRIYFRQDDGHVATLSSLWKGAGPGLVRNFVALLRVLESKRVRSTLRLIATTAHADSLLY